MKPTMLRSLLDDAFIFGGVGLISYGAWMVFEPLAFVVPGVAMLAIGILGGARR